MKVSFLCKRYYTNKDLIKDRFGRLFHLPVELSKLGVEVSVFAIDYRSSSFEKMAADGVVFSTVPATILRLPCLVMALEKIVNNEMPDILISSGDSHIAFLGHLFAKRIGARFVLDVYDYYPSFRGNLIPGMKAMFRFSVRKAGLVLCVSEPLRSLLSVMNPNTLLVENGVDRKLFKPMDKQDARGMLSLKPLIPIVGYFGSITPTRGPLLIEACSLLNRKVPELRLLLAGPVKGVDIEKPWIIYHGILPQESIPDRIAACDVVVIPYADDLFNQMCGACKIAEYIACERPIVATDVSGHSKIFKDVPFSVCKPNGEDMADAISYHLDTPRFACFPDDLEWEVIGKALYQNLSTFQSQFSEFRLFSAAIRKRR